MKKWIYIIVALVLAMASAALAAPANRPAAKTFSLDMPNDNMFSIDVEGADSGNKFKVTVHKVMVIPDGMSGEKNIRPAVSVIVGTGVGSGMSDETKFLPDEYKVENGAVSFLIPNWSRAKWAKNQSIPEHLYLRGKTADGKVGWVILEIDNGHYVAYNEKGSLWWKGVDDETKAICIIMNPDGSNFPCMDYGGKLPHSKPVKIK